LKIANFSYLISFSPSIGVTSFEFVENRFW